MVKKHIITLAGDLASGKSTIMKLIQQKLGYNVYSNGAYFRSLAKEKGMSVTDFNIYVETHPEIDQQIEKSAGAYAKEHDHLIIDARLGWYVVEEGFHVYVTVAAEESARRAMQDVTRRDTEHFVSLQEAIQQIKKRTESENKRYKDLYQVDRMDMKNYHYIIDTTHISAEEATEKILQAYEEWLRK